MTVALWGGGTTDDLAERIRTGDVAIDLYRPVGLVGWYLAGDLGRAAYHLLTAGSAPDVHRAGLLRHPPAAERRWPPLAFAGQRGAGRGGQLRAPLPGRVVGVLAARRERRPLPQRRVRDLLQRDDAAAGALPRLARHAGRGAAVGGVSSRCPTTSGSASTTGWALLGALGFQVLWVRGAARAVRGRAARGDPQGGGAGWLRRGRRAPRARTFAVRSYSRHRAAVGARVAGLPRVVRADDGQRRS